MAWPATSHVYTTDYKMLKLEIEAGGLDKAADIYKVDKSRVVKWLRFNGRGGFVKQEEVGKEVGEVAVELAA